MELARARRSRPGSPTMFLALIFSLLPLYAVAAVLDISRVYTFSVDLSFWPDFKREIRSSRNSINLVQDTTKKMSEVFCDGPSSIPFYVNTPAHKQHLDARLLGWRILQGRYEMPKNITEGQLKLLFEWSRIVVIFQGALARKSEPSQLLTRLASMPMTIPRTNQVSPDIFTSHLVPAKSRNPELWNCMHSLALKRLLMTSDHMLSDSMQTLWQKLREKTPRRLHFKIPQANIPKTRSSKIEVTKGDAEISAETSTENSEEIKPEYSASSDIDELMRSLETPPGGTSDSIDSWLR